MIYDGYLEWKLIKSRNKVVVELQQKNLLKIPYTASQDVPKKGHALLLSAGNFQLCLSMYQFCPHL